MRYCYTAVVCEQHSNVKKRCVLYCLNTNDNAKIDTNIDKIEIRIQIHMQKYTLLKAGGRTIFPKLGISVEPKAGSLLYWHLR